MTHKNLNFANMFQEKTIIPVMVIKDLDGIIPMVSALVEEGYNTLEITLRTEYGLLAISQISEEMPNVNVGAGTVTNRGQFEAVAAAGAKFVVSPGHTDDLLRAAEEIEIPFLPGVATSSEAMKLYDQGYEYFKLFPAKAVGGIIMLKSILAPLPHLKFCPTGGVTEETAKEYLALSNVFSVGGSWMVPG